MPASEAERDGLCVTADDVGGHGQVSMEEALAIRRRQERGGS
jgi:hypothetical protein